MTRLVAILTFVFALSFTVIGCGEAPPEARPEASINGPVTPGVPLTGTWLNAISDTVGVGYTFNSDGTYTLQVIRSTGTNSADDDMETGSFILTKDRINFSPMKATCVGVHPLQYHPYALNGDQLVLSYSTDGVTIAGFQTFNRVNTMPGAGSSTATVVLGCFSATDGTFTPAPLLPITNQ